ncbi:hypothetical protein Zmor_022827 [Zophobas morio]|uniref:Putative inorganic phosphate cotransporter n=1 Tax=Zophobas morio TaxID=2755281 RepID=A0AA38M6R4_9CUCU|nr:hypothetical protein Zmor_022827 [Zophobas morio]
MILNCAIIENCFGTRHLQFFLLFITLLIVNGQRTCLSVAIIAMTEKIPPEPGIITYPQWTNTDTILSSFFWGYLATQTVGGQLGEHFGPKWFLVGTTILGSVCNVLIPILAQSWGSTGVIICRVVQGLSQGFLLPSTHILISRWTPLYERTTVTNVVYSGMSLGVVTSMMFTGAIAESKLGWPHAFYILGFAGIACGIILGFFGVNSPSLHKNISIDERNYIESSNSVSQKEKVPTPWRSILTSLPVWAILVSSCGENWGTFTLLTEIPSFLSNIMNFDINSNGHLSALPYLVTFFVSFVPPLIADRLISSKTLSIGTTRKIFNSIGMFVPGLALFVLGFVDGTQKVAAVALLVVAVAASSFLNAGEFVNMIDVAPNHTGTILGLTNGSGQLFSILAPLTVGFFGNDKTELILWRKVFWLTTGIYFSTGLFYAIFASGEVQTWNDLENNNSESRNEDRGKEKVEGTRDIVE